MERFSRTRASGRGRGGGARAAMLAATLAAALAAAACADDFSPIAPSDLRFSIFGYLDASADTQWVRVTTIRPLALAAPGPSGLAVTIEHLGTGRVTTLRDSLFRFSQVNPDVGTEGVYVHNFWTTERIEPGSSYRFTVRRPGEEPVEATVAVPEDYNVEVWISQDSRVSDSLRIAGLEHLVFASAGTYFQDQCGSAETHLSFKLRPGVSGVYMVPIARPPSARQGCGTGRVERGELWTVGSGVAWPAGAAHSASGLAVPDQPSNVSNALGFLGGVLTRLLPYESCTLEGPRPLPGHCRLRYDAAAATFQASTDEVRCGRGPVDSVIVRLTEIDPSPAGHRKVRTVVSDRYGQVRIAGLEPGVRYLLTARPPFTRDSFGQIVEKYAAPTDTLVFAPGERRAYVVGLAQLNECWMDPS